MIVRVMLTLNALLVSIKLCLRPRRTLSTATC